jgi:hypothetical protein
MATARATQSEPDPQNQRDYAKTLAVDALQSIPSFLDIAKRASATLRHRQFCPKRLCASAVGTKVDLDALIPQGGAAPTTPSQQSILLILLRRGSHGRAVDRY